MTFELHLPLWAIIYCGLIFANGLLTIYLSPNQTKVYIIAQLLSTLFTISFFFFYYHIFERPETLTVLLLMLLFILYQESYANKALYKKILIDNIPPAERKVTLYFVGITILFFLFPFFYVVITLFNNYF
ncbi:MAG: hypothetical protein K0U47_05240 [Epsilonproteobacteria bacterium]|nr:hypothetical protein [Campylobacterota bacterium]